MATATWEHGGSPLYTDITNNPPAGIFGDPNNMITACNTWDATDNENGTTGTVLCSSNVFDPTFAEVVVIFQLFDDGSFNPADAFNSVRLVFDWELINGPMGTATAKSYYVTTVDGAQDIHGPGTETGTYDRTATPASLGIGATMADFFAAFGISPTSGIVIDCVFYYEAGTFSANNRGLTISNLQVIANYGAAAVVTGVSPTHGDAAGGTVVTLTGTGFTGATSVTFNGTEATSVNVLSDTSLTCVSPAHAVGPVTVTVA